jgi:hypothetical protein
MPAGSAPSRLEGSGGPGAVFYNALITSASNAKAGPPENPMSADRVRWEHIQRVYELCERNVSETAHRLKMHRRTLQRILGCPEVSASLLDLLGKRRCQQETEAAFF